MEKKISSTGSKFRSLKEFLSSTRSLNHQNYDCGLKKSQHSTSNFRSSIRNTKNSVSLFNLIATNGNERLSTGPSGGTLERPLSMAFDDHQYGYAYEDRETAPRLLQNKSVSMYGLSPIDASSNADGSNLLSSSSTRNLAARLFYNLRSKFRRRRRDRNKIVDSNSTEFATLFPQETSNSHDTTTTTSANVPDSVKASNAGYQLKSVSSLNTVLDNAQSSIDYGASRRDMMTENNSLTTNEENSALLASSNNNCEGLGLTLKLLAEDGIATRSDCMNRQSPSYNQSVSPTTSQSVSPKPVKCLTKELEDLLRYGWYWGSLSKDEAETKLKDQSDGAFIVRDSSSDHYLLSLSFNSNGKTLHTRIEYRNGQFCFYMSPDSDSFNTVAELIQHCIAYSEVGIFCYSKPRRSHHNSTSYPVRLTKPISRFTEVKSLLYLSRLVIRQYVRFDLIPLLPLPSSLIEFVSEQRYI